MGTIDVNYADNRNHIIKTCTVAKDRLCSGTFEVWIVGEGNNFSLAVALEGYRAAMAGNNDPLNLVASTLQMELPDVEDVKARVLKASIKRSTDVDDGDSALKLLQILRSINSLTNPTWREEVNAMELPADVRGDILFHCPWIVYEGGWDNIPKLLIRFMLSAATRQVEGNYLYITIVNLFPYVKNYELQRIINIPQSPLIDAAVDARYEFVGGDTEFSVLMVNLGYTHEGRNGNIDHDRFAPHMVTLCFRRKAEDLSAEISKLSISKQELSSTLTDVTN